MLLAQETGYVVNTSSIFGVFAGALGPYGVSKHAVTALTETLHFNLRVLGVTHVGVSVLCPGAVRSNFGTSARNRPASAGLPLVTGTAETESAERFAALSALGASPAEVASIVVDGIRSGRFYLLTAQNRNDAVIRRGEEIVAGGPPELPVAFA